MTPTELATAAVKNAVKTAEVASTGTRITTADVIDRGKYLYRMLRREVARSYPGVIHATVELKTLTSASNVLTPTATMVKPLLIEKAISSGVSDVQYVPVRRLDEGYPDGTFGWRERGGTIVFSQAGRAAGDYRVTFLAEHIVGDGDQMDLPGQLSGIELYLTDELAAWVRECFNEDGSLLRGRAREAKDMVFLDMSERGDFHPKRGFTHGR